ncbi:auxin efflux carrier [Scheffersomyces xylosifermentans]|uniref:auxin efflux carrier n=1 Tax=Scheffersomyces xylosifermentans TaxID=1304137 RepID=UPI00315CB87C
MIIQLLSHFEVLDVASTNPDLSFQDITFLTFEAIIEVVIICFAGFICAKTGLLNSNAQKVLSQLNVDLFTPCLVFTKLAPSLSFSKMADIVIIPVFYALSTGIAFLCSRLVGVFLSLNEPEADFVTAMAVFGNSNSLPVSLTLSLAYTLPDLLWEDIEDDTADKIASRGILYLLIFQQLGQILRWSWGFNKLLRKRSHEELNTYYTKNGVVQTFTAVEAADETTSLLTQDDRNSSHGTLYIDDDSNTQRSAAAAAAAALTASKTPIYEHPSKLVQFWHAIVNSTAVSGFLAFMNPPLYAMLISVIVASVPYLQNLFFNNPESFVRSTVTNSITQLGSVSIPLILIVLGSNLYPSQDIPPPSKHYSRIVFGSLLSRMILPSFILLPLIALCVKFVKISILDDPIFLIVAFILTISPPAIQLSQISQLNGIYQKEMAGVLFWGYVVLTLPTTIFIVVTSLEVLKWAQ